MSRLVVLVAVGLLAVGCIDQQETQLPTGAEQSAKSLAPTAASLSIEASTGPSTVCESYQIQLAQSQTALDSDPSSPTLTTRVSVFTGLVDDACN